MSGAKFSKEVLGLGLATGLLFALVAPVSRMISEAPAWPAAGLTRQFGQSSTAAYNLHLVPYGVDRGLCDRSAIASDVRRGLLIPADMLGGSAIDAQMDAIDHDCVKTALEFAPDGRRILWRNGNTGLNYTLVAHQTFQTDRGIYCREYTVSAAAGNRAQDVHEQACRQPSGSWALSR